MTDFEISLERLKDVEPQDDWTEADRTHLKTIKLALEKQILKKVTHEATLLRCCTCPTCKNVADKFEKWGESTVRITYNHCQICGQALDWSDESK